MIDDNLHRLGHAPHVSGSNGTPTGPRIKRAGWSGWFLLDPLGRPVCDGYCERVDPVRRPPVVVVAVPKGCGRPGHTADRMRHYPNGQKRCLDCQKAHDARRVRPIADRRRITAERAAARLVEP